MADNIKRELRLKFKRERTDAAIGKRCGMNADKVRRLVAAGYDTFQKIRGATDEELKAIPGIGPGQIKKIRDAINGDG